jgi:hypothetical protein
MPTMTSRSLTAWFPGTFAVRLAFPFGQAYVYCALLRRKRHSSNSHTQPGGAKWGDRFT